jgi:hypothetical protein
MVRGAGLPDLTWRSARLPSPGAKANPSRARPTNGGIRVLGCEISPQSGARPGDGVSRETADTFATLPQGSSSLAILHCVDYASHRERLSDRVCDADSDLRLVRTAAAWLGPGYVTWHLPATLTKAKASNARTRAATVPSLTCAIQPPRGRLGGNTFSTLIARGVWLRSRRSGSQVLFPCAGTEMMRLKHAIVEHQHPPVSSGASCFLWPHEL